MELINISKRQLETTHERKITTKLTLVRKKFHVSKKKYMALRLYEIHSKLMIKLIHFEKPGSIGKLFYRAEKSKIEFHHRN